MKFLIRVVLIALLITFILGCVWAVHFLPKYLNSDEFLNLLESTLSEKVGYKADVEKTSISWDSGLGLKVYDLRLQRSSKFVPFLEAQSVFLRINPFDLFQKRLLFYEIVIQKPNLLFLVNVEGRNWEATPGKTGREKAPNLGPSLFFSKIRLKEGHILYRNETKIRKEEYELNNIDARADQVFPGATISLSGDMIYLGPVKRDIHLKGQIEPKTGEVNLNLNFSDRQIILEGNAFPFQKPVRFQTIGKMDELDLNIYSRLFFPETQGITGKLYGNFELAGIGFEIQELKSSLSGKGGLEVQKGAFRNINLVSSILSRISVIPGVEELIMGKIPKSLEPVFKNKDTSFDLLQIQFSVQSGQVTVHNFLLKNNFYLVQLQGILGLDGNVNLNAKLVLFEQISDFLVARIKEFSFLMNDQSHVVIPFVYRGYGSSARPQPDLVNLTEKLVQEQGARLLQKGLDFFSKQERGTPT